MTKKEAAHDARFARKSLRPVPTTEDLARSIEALDATLSEVLVLLYHVVQTNQRLAEALEDPHSPPKLARSRPVLVHSGERRR